MLARLLFRWHTVLPATFRRPLKACACVHPTLPSSGSCDLQECEIAVYLFDASHPAAKGSAVIAEQKSVALMVEATK
jgi:hypothetical protein